MDIDYILDCLSKISENDLYQTHHLEIRIHQRKTELIPDLNSVKSISFNLVTYYLVNSNKRKREDNE